MEFTMTMARDHMKYILLFLPLVIWPAALTAQEAACVSTKTQNSQTLRKLLEEQQDSRKSPCLPQAIKYLGRAQDVRAIHVLISYLDYLDPETAPDPNGGATVRPRYPAIDALFLIGKPATSELILAIQSGKSPKIRDNAVKAFEYVYRSELSSGVRELKSAERLANDAEERRRLDDARRKLFAACSARDEEQAKACRTAQAG
jgi:hypothetical protein